MWDLANVFFGNQDNCNLTQRGQKLLTSPELDDGSRTIKPFVLCAIRRWDGKGGGGKWWAIRADKMFWGSQSIRVHFSVPWFLKLEQTNTSGHDKSNLFHLPSCYGSFTRRPSQFKFTENSCICACAYFVNQWQDFEHRNYICQLTKLHLFNWRLCLWFEKWLIWICHLACNSYFCLPD